MVWVLWVQITFTAVCMSGDRCPLPYTSKIQVRTYVTEASCQEDVARTREQFETVQTYLDDLKNQHGETPAPARLLPGRQDYRLWCAPQAKVKR